MEATEEGENRVPAAAVAPEPVWSRWAWALRVTAVPGRLVVVVPSLVGPERTPGMVGGAAGVPGDWGRTERPWIAAAVELEAPLPEPPRGGRAAPPPGRLAGFHRADRPEVVPAWSRLIPSEGMNAMGSSPPARRIGWAPP